MLNVSADYPDLRDRYYQPNLTPLKPFIDPPGNLVILDQGKMERVPALHWPLPLISFTVSKAENILLARGCFMPWLNVMMSG